MANEVKVILSAEDRSKAAFASVRGSLGKMRGEAAGLSRVLAGLIPALTVGGLAAFAKRGIDAADALNDMSQRTGVAVKTLAEYKLAATLADTSLDELAKGIQRLTLSMGKAEQGGKAQADALKRLGITTKDPKIALEQLAEAVAKSNDPTRTAADLAAVLGKSYINLLPLLQGGAQGLRNSAAASATFAEQMERLAPDAAKFNDDLDLLKTNAAGAASILLTRMVPGLSDTSKRVRELLDEDKGIQALGRAIAGLSKLPFDAIFGDIKIASNAAERIKEMRGELERLEGVKSRGKTSILGAIFGTPEKLDQQIMVLKNQIAAMEKFGEKIYKPKPAAPAAGSPRAPAGLSPADDAAAEAAAKSAEAAAKAAARAAASAAKSESDSLAKAQEALRAAQADAAAQGLESGLDARHAILEQRRRAELLDEETFIRAKALLDEEGLRNELDALQAQQSALQAASTNPSAKASERTNALAELALVDARILSAGDKILNLNVAATAELSALGASKLKNQLEFMAALEQEARLSGLSNDERETALLLLEAEKLGITDINRLLELQGQIRQAANDKTAAEESQRQQDDVYKSVQQGVQRAFADGLNSIGTEGGGMAALKGLVDTVKNAMGNALAGSLTDSFLGIAGSLGLGGKKDGSSPGSAIYVSDVAKGGALGAAAGATGGGGVFDGIMSMFSGLLDGLKTGLSGLISSIGNFVSGLFSSGGGGGGGGSNVSGWVSAIASAFGYADGGWTGPGSKYQPAGIVHADEFVFDKVATNRIGVNALENMRRIASGSFVSSRPRTGYAEGGLVNLPGSAAPNVTSNTKVVNMFDLDSALAEYLNTRSGERAVLNIIQRNPSAAGA